MPTKFAGHVAMESGPACYMGWSMQFVNAHPMAALNKNVSTRFAHGSHFNNRSGAHVDEQSNASSTTAKPKHIIPYVHNTPTPAPRPS